MSIFPTPDQLLPDVKKLEAMNKEISALMPKEFAGAVNLMVHPVAGVAAVSALGLGVASQVFGVWMGAVAGAVETVAAHVPAAARRGDGRGFPRSHKNAGKARA